MMVVRKDGELSSALEEALRAVEKYSSESSFSIPELAAERAMQILTSEGHLTPDQAKDLYELIFSVTLQICEEILSANDAQKLS